MQEQNHQNQPQQEQPQSQQQPSRPQNSEIPDNESLKRIIEALIFASDKPLQVRQIKDIVGDVDVRLIRKLIDELKQEYSQSQRSFEIVEIAGGFQFTTNPAYGRWLKKLYNIRQSDYLTGPSLETLAIIAYKQPVTKADIEFIRGVNVDGVINNLLEKGLIRITGKKEVVGRPFLYGTTADFLQYFGLNSTEELPALAEFKESDLDFQNRNRVVVENKQQQEETPANGGGKNEETEGITQKD